MGLVMQEYRQLVGFFESLLQSDYYGAFHAGGCVVEGRFVVI